MGAQQRNKVRFGTILGVFCASTMPFLGDFAAAAEENGPQTTLTSDNNGVGGSNQTEEVVTVTGSRLPAAVSQGAQDVHIYELPRIEQSGQSTVTDFLNSLPEVSLNSVPSTFIGTTVRLRGAPAGSALVLINGRRTEPVTGGVAAFGFFDLNTIPLAL